MSKSSALSNKADAAPPEWYYLPLNTPWNGNISRSCYRKDQFGFMHLNFGVIRDTMITGKTEVTVATLPTGFRPEAYTTFVGFDFNSTDVVRIYVGDDGVIKAAGTSESQQWRTVHGSVIFFAG